MIDLLPWLAKLAPEWQLFFLVGAQVVVELTGNEAKLLASLKRILDQNKKTEDSFKGVGTSSKKTSDEAVKDAQRVERESKKAAEEIYREHKKLLDQRERDVRQSAINERAIARETAFAEVKEAIVAAEGEIAAAQRITATKRRLSDQEKTLHASGMENLTGTITAVGALTAAIGTASQAWNQYKTARDAAVASSDKIEDPNRRLVQVAAGPEDLKMMQKRADSIAAETGIPRDVSRKLLFSARSEGFEKEFPAIAAANQVIDPESAAVVAGKVPTLFQKKIGPIESVSLALKAAQASNLNFEQLATSLPAAAEGGSLAGASPAELMATQSVLAARFKSGDVSADRIKAFTTVTGIDDSFKGLGIVKAVKKIKAMPDEERKEFLGKSQEMNTAYLVLSQELDKIEAMQAVLEEERVDFAAGGGMLRNQIKVAESDPVMKSRKEMQKAKIREEVEREENLVQEGLVAQKVTSNASAIMEGKKPSLINRMFTNAASGIFGAIGFDQGGMVANVLGDALEAGVTGQPVNFSAPNSSIRSFLKQRSQQFNAKADIDRAMAQQANPGPQNADAVNTEVVSKLDEQISLATEQNRLLNKLNLSLQAQIDGANATPGAIRANLRDK